MSSPNGVRLDFGPYKGPIHRGGGWISPSIGQTPIIYASSYNGDFINMYELRGTNQKVVGQLTNSIVNPEGIVVDGQHRLWVANANGGDILGFQRGATTPFTILDDANEFPVSVAVDESGNVYAANAEGVNGGGPGVTVWKRGHTEPTGELPAGIEAIGLGVDAQGDLFVSYMSGLGPKVEMFPKGSQTPQAVNITNFSPGDMIFDDQNDLVMENGGCDLGFWPPPYNGNPLFALLACGNEPTLNVTEKKVWVALTSAQEPSVNEFDTLQGMHVDSITDGFSSTAWPYGIAIDPRASLSN